jgi:6-phospho-3-hexuloisomerase
MIQQNIERICNNIIEAAKRTTIVRPEKIINVICNSKRIFITGAGRSFLVAKAFGIRLTQLGLECHIVGQPTTPRIDEDDLLLIVSGSGETKTGLMIAEIARQVNASILIFTAKPTSTLAKLGSVIVHIDIPDKDEEKKTCDNVLVNTGTPTLMGTLFELSTMLFFDALVIEILEYLNETEENMRNRHATLE